LCKSHEETRTIIIDYYLYLLTTATMIKQSQKYVSLRTVPVIYVRF